MPSALDIKLHVTQTARDLLAELTRIEQLVTRAADVDELYAQVSRASIAASSSSLQLNLWGPENRLLSSELWNIAGHLL